MGRGVRTGGPARPDLSGEVDRFAHHRRGRRIHQSLAFTRSWDRFAVPAHVQFHQDCHHLPAFCPSKSRNPGNGSVPIGISRGECSSPPATPNAGRQEKNACPTTPWNRRDCFAWRNNEWAIFRVARTEDLHFRYRAFILSACMASFPTYDFRMPSEVVIRLSELRVYYGSFLAVDGLNLELYRGELFGLLGPNGAGKSTTVRVMIGQHWPSSGHATVCGLDVAREWQRVQAPLRLCARSRQPFRRIHRPTQSPIFRGVVQRSADARGRMPQARGTG